MRLRRRREQGERGHRAGHSPAALERRRRLPRIPDPEDPRPSGQAELRAPGKRRQPVATVSCRPGSSRGRKRGDEFACEAPHSVVATIGTDLSPLLILNRIADHMRALGSNNSTTQGEQLVVLSPFLAQHLDAHGWDRSRVQQHLWDCARRPLAEVRPRSAQRPDNDPRWWWPWLPPGVDQSDDSSLVPSASNPASIHVVVSGASGGRFCAVCPGWGHFGGFAVTKPVNTGASLHDRERGDDDAGS